MRQATLDAIEVKSRIDALTFYRSELPNMPEPKRSFGWQKGGLCPFHGDERPGSFFVEVSGGAFKCFSCGASGGDILAFMMQRDEMGFREALERLASDWGVM